MTLLLLLVPLVLATTAPADPAFVSVDGGNVPVAAPGLSPGLAKALAPELSPDGGQLRDGGQAPTLTPPTLSVYKVDLPAEAAITAGSFGLYFMVDILIKPTLPGDTFCRTALLNGQCDPSDLSAFDRYAVGKSSLPWQSFSDIALAASLAIPVLYLGLESLVLPTKTPWGDFVGDLVVVAESLALTASIQTILKFSFRRPRPARYGPLTATSADLELSLPSGHASIVTAATTALTTTVFMRHPDSPMRFVVLGAGVALSALTGFARVQSGQHFPTDAITGLLIGGTAGFIIPWMHRKQLPVAPSVAFNPTTGTTFLVFSGEW